MCTALAALPRCIIVPSEAGECSARSVAQPISMWEVVMSQPWLHYPDLSLVCVCLCMAVYWLVFAYKIYLILSETDTFNKTMTKRKKKNYELIKKQTYY